ACTLSAGVCTNILARCSFNSSAISGRLKSSNSMCIKIIFLRVVRLVYGELADNLNSFVVAAVAGRGNSTRNFLKSDRFLPHWRRGVNDRENPTTRNWGPTWLGLFVALFGILIVRAAVYAFYPPYSFPAAIWRESLNWLCTIALLLIIRFGERLPFRSVGFGRATPLQSLGWGVVLTVVCMLLGAVVIALTHYTGGSSGAA